MNKNYFLNVIIRHHFTRHILAASLLSLVAACGGGVTPSPILPFSSIKQIFDATVDMAGSQPAAMQGMSVGLQTEDGQTWLRGVGFKDNAKNITTDPQSQYRIGSLTKSFTSTAILQLVDQGLITLDQTVSEILPDMAKIVPNASAITLRNLLEMRSGLTDYLCQESLNYPGLGASVFDEWFESISNGEDASYTPAKLVQASVQQKYMCGIQTPQPPRDVFDYANVNYILAAMMAEKASCSSSKGCQKIESLINDGIIKKLGMTRTMFVTDGKFSTSNFAQASASGVDVTFIGPKVPWASGAMISVPEEELLWGRELALNTSKLLSDSSHQLRKTVKSGGLMGSIPTSYGMGTYNLVSSGTGTTDLFGHSGSIATWTTSVFYSPSLKMGFSINMTNSGSTASWFPTYGAGTSYGGVLKTKFNPQTMLWSLERNIRLAVESSGTCSTLGTVVGNGAGGNCSGDSVRTSSLNISDGGLVINPSGKTFNQANIITATNSNSWTGFDATIQNSPVNRPSLAFFGNNLTGVTIGDSGNVTLPSPSVVESTGLGSSGFTLTGKASELTLGGTVLSMGANTVAVKVLNSAVSSKLNVSSTANIQGDIVLSGDVTVQIDGKVDGKLVVNGTKVKLLGSGVITGCIQYISGATLAAGSMITALTCPNGQVNAIAAKPSRKISPQLLWFY